MKTFIQFSIIISTLCIFSSCLKRSTVKVSVMKQSQGQPAVIASGQGVLMRNTKNQDDFYMELASAQGIAIFDEVKPGEYKISAEVWDGSKGLSDETIIQVKNGKDVDAQLLLE